MMRRWTMDSSQRLDRYIPRRRGSDLSQSYRRLCSASDSSMNMDVGSPIPETVSTPTSLDSPFNTFDTPISEQKAALSMSSALDVSDVDHYTPVHTKKTKRTLPSSPERRLDMPNINEDFFTNPFAWSAKDYIAVALKDNVYCWDHKNNNTAVVPLDSAEVDQGATDDNGEPCVPCVTAVVWDRDGGLLAMGTDDGCIMIWSNIYEGDLLRVLGPLNEHIHDAQVDAMAWARKPDHDILFTALSCGCMRETSLHVKTCKRKVKVITDTIHVLSTAMRVCGMKVSPTDHFLAFSGDDSRIHIWELTPTIGKNANEILNIDGHTGNIKALAFCPWQPNFLASGGAQDGTIKGHRIAQGIKLFDIDTKSQVCCLVWCAVSRELISGHGFPEDQPAIRIWAYPNMTLVGCLRGHMDRIIGLDISPNGCTLASLSTDESLYLWKIAKIKTPKRSVSSLCLISPSSASPLSACIR